MKKYVIILMFLFLTGCGMNELEDIEFESSKSEMRDFVIKENNQIEPEQLNLEDCNEPRDITLINDEIYLLDGQPSRIKRYDLDGNFIDHYDLKYIPNPSLMKATQDNIYIYDNSINKIFVMNMGYDIIQEISIKSIMPDSKMIDMEVNQNKIYLSADAVDEKDAVVVGYDLQGNEEIIVKNVNGFIDSFNGSLFMANTLEYVSNDEAYGFQAGSNSYSKIYPEKKDVLKFPNAYMPVDFVSTDNQLYVYNTSIQTLDSWNLNTGEYENTLLNFNGSEEINVKLDMNENVLVILMRDSKQVYKLHIK